MAIRDTDTPLSFARSPRGPLNVSLWLSQVLLAAFYGLTGGMKLTMPISQLAAMFKWPGLYGEGFTRFLGVCEFAGALGLLLPAATRIFPRLTPVAAACLVLLQICAIGYHASQGELAKTPVNLVLLATAAFILWGRWRKAPIPPR